MICLIYIVLVLWNSAQIDIHDLLDLYSASSLEQCSDRHVTPLQHIILSPSEPVSALTAFYIPVPSDLKKPIHFLLYFALN